MSTDKTREFIQQHASEFNNSLKVVEMLLTHHAEVNIMSRNGLTALGNSVTEENPLLVHMLLAHGANVDIPVKSMESATPLNLAAQNRNVTIARMLPDKGEKVNTTDRFGKSALDYAMSREPNKIIELLRLANTQKKN